MRKRKKWSIDGHRELVRVIECLALNCKHPIALHNGDRPVVFVETGSDFKGKVSIYIDKGVNVYTAINQVMDDGYTVSEPYENCVNDYYRIEIPQEKRAEAKDAFASRYQRHKFVHEYGIKVTTLQRL